MYIRVLFLLCTLLFPFFTKAESIQELSERYNKREVMITMRDGIKLATTIYEPKSASTPRPIIMRRTPYSCAPYGEEFYYKLVREWSKFTENNYIIVIQDVRGRHHSEGEWMQVRPLSKSKEDTDEATDTYDTIEWLVNNTNNNGCVGIWGFSYDGFYTIMAAASNHPALKAISPQAPITNWFLGDDRHHNGAFTLLQSFDFLPQMEGPYKGTKDFYWKIIRNDVYTDLLNIGTYANISRLMNDTTNSMWNSIGKHPNYDDFWKKRDTRTICYNIKPAVMVVGGSYDTEDCWGTWELFKAICRQSPETELYLTMGPWWHGGWARRGYTGYDHFYFGKKTSDYYLDEIEYPFFRYYLEGKGERPKHKINTFYAGENEWKYYNEWPLTNINIQPFYLHEKGKVETVPPTESQSYSEYISDMEHPIPFTPEPVDHRMREYDDQRFASARPDVLTFSSEPLQDTLRIAGPIEVHLMTAISSTDADFVVKVLDVYPPDYKNSKEAEQAMERKQYQMGGFQHFVRGDIFRGRYRESFEHPKAFIPNKITPVNFSLSDVTHTFLPGHRVMIQIQSSWFPLFDRNPQRFINTYTCSTDDFQMQENIRIYHQHDAASYVSLPILKGD